MNCRFSRTHSISSTSTYNIILNSYNSYTAAAVICQGYNSSNSNICEQREFRVGNLTQTLQTIEGRVEICDNGEWLRVCGSWTSQQTLLLCEQMLGHAPKGIIY